MKLQIEKVFVDSEIELNFVWYLFNDTRIIKGFM